jgi:hypothetical protein
MKFYPGNILVLLFLLIGLSASANDTAYVKFTFAAPLNSKVFFIILQDGINEYKIDPQNTQSWRGELFSPFGYILTGYHNSDTTAIIRKAFFKKGNPEGFQAYFV